MAKTATPMGAEPVGGLSACGSFSGKVRHIKIASGYNTAIFYGDFVKLVAAGTVEKDTGTATATPVGIFMGCFYTDPSTSQPTFNQTFPASTAASDIMAYVAIVQTAGSTTVGRSKNAVNASTAATTNTLPLRIIEFMDGPDSVVGDAFTDVLLTYNAGMHQYRRALGT